MKKFFYSYIVRNELNIIGLITLTKVDDDSVVFSHIINSTFRGEHYSSKIKLDMINYLMNNNIVNRVIYYIDKYNKNSISSMMRTNTTKIERCENNMLMVIYENMLYKKHNPTI